MVYRSRAMTAAVLAALVSILVVVGCSSSGSSGSGGAYSYRSSVPDDAADIRPAPIGDELPQVTLRTPRGEPFDLSRAVSERPAVLIFYRGGWCPYCTLHLSELKTVEDELRNLGFRILAISPDRPAKLRESIAEEELTYTLLSDSDMRAARALGIAFRVDDKTVHKYKTEYEIDLEADSGRAHHLLPAPSVFIVDREGVIRFTYVNPNYKVRIDPQALVAAARGVVEEK